MGSPDTEDRVNPNGGTKLGTHGGQLSLLSDWRRAGRGPPGVHAASTMERACSNTGGRHSRQALCLSLVE